MAKGKSAQRKKQAKAKPDKPRPKKAKPEKPRPEKLRPERPEPEKPKLDKLKPEKLDKKTIERFRKFLLKERERIIGGVKQMDESSKEMGQDGIQDIGDEGDHDLYGLFLDLQREIRPSGSSDRPKYR